MYTYVHTHTYAGVCGFGAYCVRLYMGLGCTYVHTCIYIYMYIDIHTHALGKHMSLNIIIKPLTNVMELYWNDHS